MDGEDDDEGGGDSEDDTGMTFSPEDLPHAKEYVEALSENKEAKSDAMKEGSSEEGENNE